VALAVARANDQLGLPFRLGAVVRDDCYAPELAFVNSVYFIAPRIGSIFTMPLFPLTSDLRSEDPLRLALDAFSQTTAAPIPAENPQRTY
jgi:hypothetical protein